MPKLTLGIVCHVDENDINSIIQFIEGLHDEVIYVKSGWGRLYIKGGDDVQH